MPTATNRVPPWILLGGATLAAIAGFVNAVAVLGLDHQAVSHVTGTTTLAALAAVVGDLPRLGHLAMVVLCFFLGAVLSAVIVVDSRLRFGRRYGVALMLESALLLGAMLLLERGSRLGDYAASLACGLQNALATTYSGAVVRTTHLSGMFTDLGVAVGHLLRGLPVHGARMLLYLALCFSFVAGAVLGALGFATFSYSALAAPSAICGAAGLAYMWRRLRGTGRA